ncbi:isochorismatase family protein [Noviherbaspirillum saxi]|uniref:Isochorismatase family protein n=1 Tax=Noviherbaspirillum saxi TaxID=2320863 RepID=A0A3A3FQ40_9BURK|nr:isochorismatase family protein [Noviherbaspirillum saxi]RJF97314.1 isochorismatase family protein [Noviherbaspirillum saxi]
MSSLCDPSRATLVIIDLQERLMPAIHDSASVVANALRLAQTARLLAVPVVGTAQSPSGLGPNVPEIGALCDSVIAKTDFDACAERAFMDLLREERGDLIIAGCEAHVCVLQTVLGLRARQRRVRLVADGIGSRVPFNKTIALERAKAAGAELVTTEMVLFEWMRNSTHPRFKDMLKLIR